jgi:diguanylate cyclase (GGDEF)-like protein
MRDNIKMSINTKTRVAKLKHLIASRWLTWCACVTILLLPCVIWSLLQLASAHPYLVTVSLIALSLLLLLCIKAFTLTTEHAALTSQITSLNQILQSEITFRAMTEKLLSNSEAQYQLVTDALPVLISYVDTSLRYRFINKAYTDWFGEEVDTIVGKTMRRVIGDSAFVIFKDNIAKLANKNIITFETLMNFRNKEDRYVSVTLIPHFINEEIHGFFSLISYMTPRINHLATHDVLTNLPNRSLFNAKCSQALVHAQQTSSNMALLFLDLDHFKNINDTLGHDVGDLLLKRAAERIHKVLDQKDMLARLGGDEFIILLEMTSPEQVTLISNKICQAFSQPFNLNNHELQVTASIGVSLFPDHGRDMQILLKNADIATYHAKKRGRNTYEFYTDAMNTIIVNKTQLETGLRQAIEKHEFVLYYQPVMDVPSNSITSLEALVRWYHPEKGIIAPGEFLPVAEESGLIVPIGDWILTSVCQQNAKWQNHANFPVNLRISINLTARQFHAKNLVAMIQNVLEATQLSGKYLTVELTESLIINNIEYSGRVMAALKDLGVSISIDDFGTGYSSLNYLRRFPIDMLKIDKSFIKHVTQKADEAAIVNAIIAMAHSFKMKVIAEGVETLGQYYFLKDRGCDEIQGYLLSKPMPANEIEVFLKNAFSVEAYLNSQSS